MNNKIIIGIVIIVITIGIFAVVSINNISEDTILLEDTVSIETSLTVSDSEADYIINEHGQKTFIIGVGDSPVIGD